MLEKKIFSRLSHKLRPITGILIKNQECKYNGSTSKYKYKYIYSRKKIFKKTFPPVSVISIVCDCGHNKANSEMLKNAAMAYQRELRALVNSGRYDTRNDFTVVLQPFFKNTEPPTLVRLGNYGFYFVLLCFKVLMNGFLKTKNHQRHWYTIISNHPTLLTMT